MQVREEEIIIILIQVVVPTQNLSVNMLYPISLLVASVGCTTFCPLFAHICLEDRAACVASVGVREGGNP